MEKRNISPFTMSTGSRMRFLRAVKNYTQKEASERAEMSDSLWRQYESGVKVPKAEQLEKIAFALGVPTNILLPNDIISFGGTVALIFELMLAVDNDIAIVDAFDSVSIKIPKTIPNQQFIQNLTTINNLFSEVDCDTIRQEIERRQELYEAVKDIFIVGIDKPGQETKPLNTNPADVKRSLRIDKLLYEAYDIQKNNLKPTSDPHTEE